MLNGVIILTYLYLRGDGIMAVFPCKKCVVSLIIFILFCTGQVFTEVIKQDFNSEADFNAFWNVSTWGISGTIQYSADNVWIDETNGLLVLKLSASPPGTTPVCGEVSSKRSDFLYGSYRASIKVCDIPGSVIGWFVYKDGIPGDGNLHEVDVEYLTNNLSQIHFTLHHDEFSVEHQVKPVSFDPTADFHEYRFDWYPDKVEYYIDSEHVATLTTKVPDAACTIMLNHWSKNLTDWGGPAPTEDTYMYIDYMHYYSDPTAVTEQDTHKDISISETLVFSYNNELVDIHWMQASSPQVVLSVFSMGGRLLARFVKIPVGSGENSIRWDTDGLADGVYYLELNAGTVRKGAVFHLVR